MKMEGDRSAVAQARQAWTKAMLEGDLVSLRALYTDDVVVMPMDERPIVGRQAVDEWYRAFHRNLKLTDWVIPADNLELIGDVALVRGTGTGTVVAQGGPRIPMDFKYVEIWRKQPDQTWRWSLAMWNSNVPASGG
jgi:uncharacterized protein (TIGR02246 family)